MKRPALVAALGLCVWGGAGSALASCPMGPSQAVGAQSEAGQSGSGLSGSGSSGSGSEKASPQDDDPDIGRAASAADDVARKVPLTMPREAVRAPIDRAVAYLVRKQNDDGSWGNDAPTLMEMGFALNTFRAWRMASQAICCMALARADETPERRAALDRATRWLIEADLPRRDSDWDIDYVWTSLYGFVATVELLGDARFQEDAWRPALEARATEFLRVLERHQAASGGWAYYDDPPFDVQPTWATSFCTALVLPSLVTAKARGVEVKPSTIERATRYLNRCALPNGAYSYDLTPVTRLSGVEHINLMEGSLGRTQVGNWARRANGDRRVTDEVIREGLEAFFRKHGYLDHVRLRPVPHEGFHANAGYFYFFAHYYAAEVIELLPAEEREGWHARLRPHLAKTQRDSGACSDFLDSDYLVNASTAFLAMSLELGSRRSERSDSAVNTVPPTEATEGTNGSDADQGNTKR